MFNYNFNLGNNMIRLFNKLWKKYTEWLFSSHCKICNHECHCENDLHTDEYGVCTCDNCKCE